MSTQVLIIMGSESDRNIMKVAYDLLKEFGIECEMTIASAHRSPERAMKLAAQAEGKGIEVIIAGAGMAAHLAGVLASHTILPVIGVPIDAPPFNGLDSLLSTVQMPSGVPVAAMSVGKAGAKNAAILAAQIIARKDEKTARILREFKKRLAEEIDEKARLLKEKE